MPDALSREHVLATARLARLALSDEDVALFATQLTAILDYVEQIRDVDTSGVAPTSHAAQGGLERPDAVRPSLPADEALGNAPDAARDAGLFKVPRVMA